MMQVEAPNSSKKMFERVYFEVIGNCGDRRLQLLMPLPYAYLTNSKKCLPDSLDIFKKPYKNPQGARKPHPPK